MTFPNYQYSSKTLFYLVDSWYRCRQVVLFSRQCHLFRPIPEDRDRQECLVNLWLLEVLES